MTIYVYITGNHGVEHLAEKTKYRQFQYIL